MSLLSYSVNKIEWQVVLRSVLPSYFGIASTFRFLKAIMFTGLVRALGTLEQVSDDRVEIKWQAGETFNAELEIGDSVAVDGVCLTVVRAIATGFLAAVSPETLRRSTLGRAEFPVNLEPSLCVGDKLGGHFVTGHVDGIGYLLEATETGSAWEMTFGARDPAWMENIAPYLVPKGSIAVNGISLTIADCDRASQWFRVAVIPHTYHHTNLCALQPGSPVNLEADILGKYVRKMLGFSVPGDGKAADITPELLLEHGYL